MWIKISGVTRHSVAYRLAHHDHISINSLTFVGTRWPSQIEEPIKAKRNKPDRRLFFFRTEMDYMNFEWMHFFTTRLPYVIINYSWYGWCSGLSERQTVDNAGFICKHWPLSTIACDCVRFPNSSVTCWSNNDFGVANNFFFVERKKEIKGRAQQQTVSHGTRLLHSDTRRTGERRGFHRMTSISVNLFLFFFLLYAKRFQANVRILKCVFSETRFATKHKVNFKCNKQKRMNILRLSLPNGQWFAARSRLQTGEWKLIWCVIAA